MKKFGVLVFALFMVTAAHGGNWPQWRGPEFNGTSDETNLPTKWSRTENVAWVAQLPGPSAATPIVWEDRVFVSTTDLKSETVKAICLNRKSGKILWQHDIAKGVNGDYRSTFAAPSPATDGKVVVFFTGKGEMVVYDLDGKKKWSKNFGPFAFQWTFSTSPVLFDGRLYLQVCQRDKPVRGRGSKDGKNQSYLLALNPETGEQLFRQVRPSNALAESLEAFTTPTPYVHNGKKQLLIAGGDCLTSHDPKTGKEIWRWGTWNPDRIPHWRLVPSPVAGDNIALVCAPKRDPIYAISTDGKGQLGEKAVTWDSREARELSSDVPTPAFYDGDFFVLSDVRKNVSRVEPKTGRVKWSITTPGRSKYEASPTVADGKIYLINFDGEVAVVNAKTGDLDRVIPMGPDKRTKYTVRSSVAVAQGQLFIRTVGKLYCIGR
ncbi:MAG: PQQ-binding-like beta-propeller repeat protein [Planctomycetes bacterium]|nr:PQQ-binding-like beta-propeller repeat protein [Planctomycetota bacterium]